MHWFRHLLPFTRTSTRKRSAPSSQLRGRAMRQARSVILVSAVTVILVAYIAANTKALRVALWDVPDNRQKISTDSESTFTLSIASDTNTEYFSNFAYFPAVEAWKHSAWPSLPGATWIWKSYLVTSEEALNGTSVITFRRIFNLPEQVESASGILRITADNAYEVRLNGILVGHDGVLHTNSCDPGYKTVESYSMTLLPGENVLSIQALNYKDCNGNSAPKSNPAGVLFRLDITYTLGETSLFLPTILR